MRIISLDPSLRGFGVYSMRDGIEGGEVKKIPTSVDRVPTLGRILSWLSNIAAEGWDLCIVEDYAFEGGKNNFRAGTIQAEVGGVARAMFSARKVPVIEIDISTWKAVTGVRINKGNSTYKSDYQNAVMKLYGKRFDSVDIIDAFLFYQTVKKCGIGPAIGDGPVRIKRQLEDLRINAEEM